MTYVVSISRCHLSSCLWKYVCALCHYKRNAL